MFDPPSLLFGPKPYFLGSMFHRTQVVLFVFSQEKQINKRYELFG